MFLVPLTKCHEEAQQILEQQNELQSIDNAELRELIGALVMLYAAFTEFVHL